jgi:hypothetical protein
MMVVAVIIIIIITIIKTSLFCNQQSAVSEMKPPT